MKSCQKLVRLLYAGLMLAFGPGMCNADVFDVYFLGGQSNMEGFGKVDELSEEQRKPIQNAFIFQATPVEDQRPVDGNSLWVPLAAGHGTGFVYKDGKLNLSDRFGCELSFASSLLERKPNRKIAIIKYARNGSSIAREAAGAWGCWEPDFEASQGQYRDINQYDQMLETICNAMDVRDVDGDGVNDQLVPAGIVWMQGESDAASTEEVARKYEANLKRLMDLIRAALRTDDLPVAIGRISDSKKGQKDLVWRHGDLVRQAQASFVKNDRYARLVTETDDYNYSDPWHYDTYGYLELGKRFAEAITAIQRQPSGTMLDEQAKLEVVIGNGNGGEGPAWDAEFGVLTSGNGNIHRWSPDGVASVFRKEAGTNGLMFDPQGRLIACEPKERRVTRTDREGNITVLTDRFEGKRYNSPNDLSIDSKGRIYFSDPRYGDRDDMQLVGADGKTVEGVYCIDLDGSVRRVIGREVERANGVLVSFDNKHLYVADNNNNTAKGNRKLWRFVLKEDGSVDLTTQRLLFDWGRGRGPDGLKQDVNGNLYVAAGLNRSNPPYEPDDSVLAGVYVLDLDGNLIDFIAVPRDEVTNCAFGDDDRRTLFITGGGTLYKVRTKNAGFFQK